MCENINSNITKSCLNCNKIIISSDRRTRFGNRFCYETHRQAKPIDKICAHCGKHFEVDHMARRKKHCSLECRYTAFSQRKMPPPKNANKTCKGCGNIFDANHCKRLYCHHDCYLDYRKRMGWQSFGEEGVNYYARLKKMKLPCRACGASPSDVHHIDGNRKNNVEENLVPLCKPCHSLLHGLCQSAQMGIKHFSEYFVNHYFEIFQSKTG